MKKIGELFPSTEAALHEWYYWRKKKSGFPLIYLKVNRVLFFHYSFKCKSYAPNLKKQKPSYNKTERRLFWVYRPVTMEIIFNLIDIHV